MKATTAGGVRENLWFTFDDGIQVAYAPGLNAGTVAVQYMLSRNRDYNAWLPEVAADGAVQRLCGVCLAIRLRMRLSRCCPLNLAQPAMQLPWSQGELWYYTGGPHGGYGTGSAWSAIDFAPPGDEDTSGCFIAPQWTTLPWRMASSRAASAAL
jgi:LasA protease